MSHERDRTAYFRKNLNTQHTSGLPLFLGIPLFKDLNYVQNNRNRSDFADAHTDLSTDAVTPLKYLIVKNYRHM